MFSKTTTTVLTIAVAGIVAFGAVSDQKLAAWVHSKVQKIEPTQQDRRMDDIGWASSITEALRLAKELGRPVFMFTHDGQVSTGRC